MGIMALWYRSADRIGEKMRFFKMRAEPELAQEKQSQSSEDALLVASLADDIMTREQAMNVPAFAACVNKITEAISTIPFKLYRTDADGRLEEIKDDRRVQLLNEDTGDTLDGVQFKRAIARDYLLGKGGYAYVNRYGSEIKSIHYVQESEISFVYDVDPIFKDYDILVRGSSYKPFEFLKILRNTQDGMCGRSIISENSEVISVTYNSLKYEKNLVKTGGNKKGFIKAANKLRQEAIDALKEAWRRLYQNNTENVVVLNNGLEFQEASNTSVEMQLNENKRTNAEEICKLFGMPTAMVNGSATEQDRADFVQFALNPILKEFECALNRELLLEKEKGTYFFAADTSELTKGDIEKRYKAYETASRNGFLQIDEIRRKENYPPLGLDFVRLGLQDVLFDPETRQFYTPNTNETGGIGKMNLKGGEESED